MDAEKIKKILKKNYLLIISVILISFFSFQLGKLSKMSIKKPIIIEQGSNIFESYNNQTNSSENYVKNASGKSFIPTGQFKVVVSKNSNKYHYPWCPGAKRIKPENQIWFNSAEEAEKAGYIKAKNCRL